jgi:hypothetical protein
MMVYPTVGIHQGTALQAGHSMAVHDVTRCCKGHASVSSICTRLLALHGRHSLLPFFAAAACVWHTRDPSRIRCGGIVYQCPEAVGAAVTP